MPRQSASPKHYEGNFHRHASRHKHGQCNVRRNTLSDVLLIVSNVSSVDTSTPPSQASAATPSVAVTSVKVTMQTSVTAFPACHLISQVLAALQILGRGVCFDDVSQLFLMSEATVCAVFHTFCSRFAKEFYRVYVNLSTGDTLTKVMGYYDKLGFSGAIGSTDVTHVK